MESVVFLLEIIFWICFDTFCISCPPFSYWNFLDSKKVSFSFELGVFMSGRGGAATPIVTSPNGPCRRGGPGGQQVWGSALAAGQRQQPVVCSPNHSKIPGIFGKSYTATLDHLVTWSCIMIFISPLCTGRCLWIHPIVIVRILNASA